MELSKAKFSTKSAFLRVPKSRSSIEWPVYRNRTETWILRQIDTYANVTYWTFSLFFPRFIFLLTKTFLYGHPSPSTPAERFKVRVFDISAENLVVLLIERKGFRYSCDAICNRVSHPIERSRVVDCIDDATTAWTDLLISFICCSSTGPRFPFPLSPVFQSG